MGIPLPAPSSRGDNLLLVVLHQVEQHLAGYLILDHGSRRNRDADTLAIPSGFVVVLALPAIFSGIPGTRVEDS